MRWLARLWHQSLRRPFRLAYETYGVGPQPVLLLHGIASDRTFWRQLTAQLDPTMYTVLMPDLLGHGASPAPGFIAYTSDDQVAAVSALCRRLKLTRCIVVGHSMGCLVATRLATIQPIIVKRLLLYEPPLFTDVPEFRTAKRRRNFYYGLYERIARNPAGTFTMTRLVARVGRNWTRHLESKERWLPIERSLRNTILGQQSYEELKNIAIDTDIVRGRLDLVVPRSNVRKGLVHNQKVRFHQTTDRHRMSRASARFLAKLIAAGTVTKRDEMIAEEVV